MFLTHVYNFKYNNSDKWLNNELLILMVPNLGCVY